MLVVGLEALSGCAMQAGTSTTGEPPAMQERGVLFRTVDAERRENRYAVYVPRDLDLTRPAPAIVFLNGRGECGTDGTRQLVVGLLPAVLLSPEKWPFIIIFPQKPNQQDTWAHHEELVLACLSAASREFKLDPSRIYLTGLSQGGSGTWEIGSRHPELFAAIAPLCGFVNTPGGPSPTLRFGGDAERRTVAESLVKSNMPVWAFHGEKDDPVPVEQTRLLMAALEKAGASPQRVKATYYPDANHNCWDKAYREENLGEWFLSHRREDPSSR